MAEAFEYQTSEPSFFFKPASLQFSGKSSAKKILIVEGRYDSKHIKGICIPLHISPLISMPIVGDRPTYCALHHTQYHRCSSPTLEQTNFSLITSILPVLSLAPDDEYIPVVALSVTWWFCFLFWFGLKFRVELTRAQVDFRIRTIENQKEQRCKIDRPQLLLARTTVLPQYINPKQ